MSLCRASKFPWQLITIMLAFIYWFGINLTSPFLSLFSKDINFNIFETSIFLSGMGIARAIIQPFIGVFLAKINAETAIKVTFIVFMIDSLGYVLSSNFIILVFCRFADGVAMGFFVIAVRVIMNNNFGFDQVKLINVYYSGVKNLGAFMGPAVVGTLFEIFGIRSIFIFSFSIFFIGYFISTRLKINNNFHKKTENHDGITFLKKPPFLLFILILHSFEYIGLGLWLCAWPILADKLLDWNGIKTGASFSVTAISSVFVIPFLKKIIKVPETKKIIGGLILLACQPLCVAFFYCSNELLWISFLLGGVGATVYFASFHSYVSTLLKKSEISVFYGFLGVFTFAGQAMGQSLAPILWNKFNYRFPLVIDFVLLVVVTVFYICAFKARYFKNTTTSGAKDENQSK